MIIINVINVLSFVFVIYTIGGRGWGGGLNDSLYFFIRLTLIFYLLKIMEKLISSLTVKYTMIIAKLNVLIIINDIC